MTYTPGLNGGRINVTLSGNSTSAGAGFKLVSSGTMTLAGGNNITLSQAGNAITISAPNAAAIGTNSLGMSNLGNTSGTTGMVTGTGIQLAFAGGNNVTLSQSINGSSGTITVSAFNQSVQTQNLIDVSLSGNTAGTMALISSGTLQLAGGNNITLSQSGGSNLTISGPNMFNAGISNIGNTNGTSGTASNQVILAGGNNITLSQSTGAGGNTITISAPNAVAQTNPAASGANGSFTFQTLSFANSNGVSFSTGTQGLYATVQTNYLTTARASTDAIGLNTAQTNVTWTVNSSGLSFNGAGYAGTGSTFNGANISGSMTHNSVGLNLSLSVAAPGGGGGVALYDGANSISSGTARFVNANGVTFTINGQSISGSVQTNYLTTAMQSNAATISNINLSAGTTSTNASAFTFANSNGVSFGLGTGASAGSITATVATNYQSQGAYLTTARASTDAIGLNTAQTNATWTVNSSGLSFNGAGYAGTGSTFNGANISGSMTHNTAGLNLSLSVAAPGGGGGVAIGDGVANITNGTAVFSDLNGVSFGVNGSTMTASVAAQSNQTMGFTATGNTTYNSTGTFDARSIIVQGDGAVSVGLSNGSLVISANAGGGANPAHSFYQNLVPQNSLQPYTTLAMTFNTLLLQPLSPIEGYGFPGDMTVSTLMLQMSGTGTATSGSSAYSSSVSFGLYLLNNSTQLSLVNSASTSWAGAAATGNSTAWVGARFLTLHSTQWSSAPVLSYNARYWYGIIHRSSNFSGMGPGWIGQYLAASTQRSGTVGVSQVSNTSIGMIPFLGIYSTSLTSMPATLGNNQINKVHALAGFYPGIILNATYSAF